MNLKFSNNGLKNYSYFNRINISKLIVYFLIAIIFYYFMQTYSPLGINLIPYHHERIVNAIRNIFENPQLSLFGYTSYDTVQVVRNHINSGIGSIYVVPLTTYIFPGILYKIIGNFQFLNYASIIDYIFISSTGIIIAEVGCNIISTKKNLDSLFYGALIFLLFLTSPWTYRLMLAPWFEVGFLAFYMLSIYFFIKDLKLLALFFLFLSFLISWIWGFLIISFLIIFSCLSNLYKKSNNFRNKYLPNGLQNKKGSLIYFSVGLLPLIINYISFNFMKFAGIEFSNSSALFRIGINNLQNIYHGGLLGAFQFLSGNRFSLCLDSYDLTQINELKKYMSIFNCSLSLLSQVLLSLFSILGLFLLVRNNPKVKWIFMPITWSLLVYIFIFQQSFAVHLHGHSYIFGLLFAIGLIYLLKYFSEVFKLSIVTSKIIIFPIVIGVVINSIRVCYITGING